MTPAPDDPKGSGAELTVPPLDSLTKEAEAIPPPELPKRKSVSIFDFASRGVKRQYVEGIFGPGDDVMFFAEPGAGKTFVNLDLWRCLGTCRPWAGFRFAADRPLRALYVSNEGLGGLSQRTNALITRHELSSDVAEVLRVWEGDPITLFEANAKGGNLLDKLNAEAEAGWRPDVVIVDTLQGACPGMRENDAQDGGILSHYLKQIRAQGWPDLVIVCVHHSKKGGGNYRGTSSLEASFDALIEIVGANEEGPGRIVCKKLKDFERFRPVYFTLEDVPGTSSAVADFSAAPVHKEADEVTDTLDLFWRDGKNPTRAELQKVLVQDLGWEPQGARQRLKRRLDQLQEKGLLAQKGEGSRFRLYPPDDPE